MSRTTATTTSTSFFSSVFEILGLAVTAPAHRTRVARPADATMRRTRTVAAPATSRPVMPANRPAVAAARPA
ncbi:MAG: hypothetical protein RLZ14_350, partial [Actinomycetota bacterium]